jgi:nitrate reductase beta subunit
VFRGLSKLVIKKVTDDWIQEHGITQEMLEEMYKFAAMGAII